MTKNKIHPKLSPFDEIKNIVPHSTMPSVFTGPLESFKGIKNIPFDSFEFNHDIIERLIKKTNTNLIKYNEYKIFFIHPKYRDYAIDIFGNIFNIYDYAKKKKTSNIRR